MAMRRKKQNEKKDKEDLDAKSAVKMSPYLYLNTRSQIYVENGSSIVKRRNGGILPQYKICRCDILHGRMKFDLFSLS